ncbi:MAG: SH3 domain-containing protein, partial [Spirochaetia bacterium]
TLVGCSRPLGYGVLLWSTDEDEIASGSVVSVVSQSDLQDTYLIRIEANRPDTNSVDPDSGQLTLTRWRVRFFEAEEDATRDAAANQELATVYARSLRNALPMRSDPELRSANIVYRLRDGEVVKLIGREDEQSDLSGLVSYWYSALTETGVEAYVFGYELSLFDPLDSDAVFAESGTADLRLQLLLDNVWRPIYFVDMIVNGAYDLKLFNGKYGLFPKPEERSLELVMPYHSTTFNYDAIVKVGPRRYLAEGTSLQLTFNRGDELSFQYVLDGRQYILAMQRVPRDIQDYVDAELERRRDTYQRLLDRGPAFSSGNYGRITLLEDERFIWSGYERLVPAVIARGLGTGGRVLLDLYLGPQLVDRFDGAVSFRFDGHTESVSFVYALVPDGIRMVYVPQTDIDEIIMTGSGVSSITLFFSATGG